MAKTTTIKVGEIHCERCEHAITTAMSNLNGVLRVTPNAKTNEVKISYDELTLREDDLRPRLVEIGFGAVG